MNLILRLIITLVKYRFDPAFRMTDKVRLKCTVLPSDLDTNIHMNNGRYLSIMDLARVALMKKLGIFRLVRKRQLMPLVASSVITYRKALLPFERYTVEAYISYWDEKWIYIVHDFYRGGDKITTGVIKGVFTAGGRTVPTSDVLAMLGQTVATSPPKPAYVDNLSSAAKIIYE